MADISDRYQYRVSWLEDDGEYVGQCLEFPSVSWLASTPEEAFTGIRYLVSGIVQDMRTNGEDIPQPLRLNEFNEYSDSF